MWSVSTFQPSLPEGSTATTSVPRGHHRRFLSALALGLLAAASPVSPVGHVPGPGAPAAHAYGATYASNCACTFCQIWCKTSTGTFYNGACC